MNTKALIAMLAGLMLLAHVADDEQPLHAQVAETTAQAAYYPGVSTYTPDAVVGAMQVVELDQPYNPAPQRQVIQYANYANYAGNYAAGYQPGYYQNGYQQQYACNGCYGDYGDDLGYFGDGGWYPGRGVRRWVANGGWFPGKIAGRWVANGGWFPGRGVLRCLFGRGC